MNKRQIHTLKSISRETGLTMSTLAREMLAAGAKLQGYDLDAPLPATNPAT